MPGLLNPEDGSYAAPPAGPSKTQGYLDRRQENLPPKESFFPGDRSQYMPSTNRRGAPVPEEAAPPQDQVVPPLPNEGGGEAIADPDPKNPSQPGGPGTAGGEAAVSSIDYETAGRNSVWIDGYLVSRLPSKEARGFIMAHSKDIDQMNRLLVKIRGQGAVARANGERMMRRFLDPKVRRFEQEKTLIDKQKKEGLLEATPELKPSDFTKAYNDYLKALKAKTV